MKKLQRNFRIVSVALASVFILAFTTAHAAEEKHVKEGNGTLPVQVQHIGYKNNSPVYQLSFTNAETEEFIITIRDNQYNVIYSEKLKGKNLTRKYQLVNEGEGVQSDDTIQIEISSTKTNNTVKYKVNNNTELVNNVEVVKVR